MNQTICASYTTTHHLDDAPFADERDRYLRHCAEHGATPASLKIKRNELLWIAAHLHPDAHKGVGIEMVQRIAEHGDPQCAAPRARARARRVVADFGVGVWGDNQKLE